MSTPRRTVRFGTFVVGGVAVALALVFLLGPHASSDPDGLDKVAIDTGLAGTERTHALDDSPTAGYTVEGIEHGGLSTGAAGAIGVAVTFVVAAGVTLLARRLRRGRDGGAPAVHAG